ncbi:hypothetical protein TNCV_2656221 [Trichonephila clavipes]|nr:hypothetical protein TNCV_2656221 [Trichonephila clavipes]
MVEEHVRGVQSFPNRVRLVRGQGIMVAIESSVSKQIPALCFTYEDSLIIPDAEKETLENAVQDARRPMKINICLLLRCLLNIVFAAVTSTASRKQQRYE